MNVVVGASLGTPRELQKYLSIALLIVRTKLMSTEEPGRFELPHATQPISIWPKIGSVSW